MGDLLDLDNKVTAISSKLKNPNLADIAMAILRNFYVHLDPPSKAIERSAIAEKCRMPAIKELTMPYPENMRRRKEAMSLQVAAMEFLSEVAADIHFFRTYFPAFRFVLSNLFYLCMDMDYLSSPLLVSFFFSTTM